MSRSKRKNLFTWLCSNSDKMKKWKNQNNRSIRRKENLEFKNQNDIPSGSSYKKLNDIWNSPSDGKFRGTEKSKEIWKYFGK